MSAISRGAGGRDRRSGPSRGGRHWFRQPALLAGLIILAIILFMVSRLRC